MDKNNCVIMKEYAVKINKIFEYVREQKYTTK